MRFSVLLWGLVVALNVASLLLPFEEDERVWEVQRDCALDAWEELFEFGVRDQDWSSISRQSMIDGLVFAGPQLLFWLGLALSVAGRPTRWLPSVLLLMNAISFAPLLLVVYPLVYDSEIAQFLQELWAEVRIGFYLWWASLWTGAIGAILLERVRIRSGGVHPRRPT